MNTLPKFATLALTLISVAGCGEDDPPVDPFFPANYADTYTEVRNCRPNGGSHDFNNIRVLADPAALPAYRDRTDPFPEGSVVLKEEYDSSDTSCGGDPIGWTVMRRLPAGQEQMLGWEWQRVDDLGEVETENESRCFGCHAACVLPDGYLGTCTVP